MMWDVIPYCTSLGSLVLKSFAVRMTSLGIGGEGVPMYKFGKECRANTTGSKE
jgi:hypothetical protein